MEKIAKLKELIASAEVGAANFLKSITVQPGQGYVNYAAIKSNCPGSTHRGYAS